MAKLEYRLLDEAEEYPVLFGYDGIDTGEIAARFLCDRLRKAGIVYEKTSTAVEPLAYVIYVREESKAPTEGGSSPAGPGVRVEVRQDWEGEAPGQLIEERTIADAFDVVLFLASDYFYWLGDEWLRTMTLLDEDRLVYVYYAKKSA